MNTYLRMEQTYLYWKEKQREQQTPFQAEYVRKAWQAMERLAEREAA